MLLLLTVDSIGTDYASGSYNIRYAGTHLKGRIIWNQFGFDILSRSIQKREEKKEEMNQRVHCEMS